MEELELVQRCRAGDYAAFEALYEMYARRALRTAYLIIHSKAAAEDAVQEAFVQVWLRISGLREPAAFRAWFYRILYHISHRISARVKRVVFLSLDLETHDKPDPQALIPEERAEANEEVAQLRRAIASLPEGQRLAVVLRYYACLQESEVAQVLGIPIGTVKSRLHNAKQVLHRTLSTSSSTDLRAGL